MSEETKKLLPCPFCGGEADLEHYTVGTWDDPEDRYEVDCTRCNASIESQSTEAEAVEAWNKRAETTVETLMRVFAYDAICGVCDKRKERTAKVTHRDKFYISCKKYDYGKCSACEAYVNKGDLYCKRCGAKLDWGE